MQAYVIEKAPKCYLQAITQSRAIKGAECTCNDIEEAMELYWRTSQGMKTNDRSSRCFEHAQNAHLRPRGWKSKGRVRNKGRREIGNAAYSTTRSDAYGDVTENYGEENNYILGLAAIFTDSTSDTEEKVTEENFTEDHNTEEISLDSTTNQDIDRMVKLIEVLEDYEDDYDYDSVTDEDVIIEGNIDELIPSNEEDVEDDDDEEENGDNKTSLFTDSSLGSEVTYAFNDMDEATAYMLKCGKTFNEIAAAGVDANIDIKLLQGEEIWIADSGCTAHMTPYKNKMRDAKINKSKVMIANGQVEGVNLQGYIVGNKVDMEGNFERHLIMPFILRQKDISTYLVQEYI